MRITSDSLRQVLDRASIEEVVGDFVTLKRRGRNLTARCPFHDERSPSFNVSVERGIYKCFGCGKSGDAVQFLQELEGHTFVEAIEWLARRYNVTLEYEGTADPEVAARDQHRGALLGVLTWAAEWFAGQLKNSEQGRAIAQSYLRERGVGTPVWETYQLGWAPEGRDTLYRAATAAHYPTELLVDAGLVVALDDGQGYLDRYRGRLIFPIQTASGRVVGFGGRTLQKAAAGVAVKIAKYINSPESEVYHKGDVLYGLWQGRAAARRDHHVYLTEGYLDVLAMHQAGYPGTVASSGTALSEAQARLLGRYATQVTLLFDGDKAGEAAALKGMDVLLTHGLEVWVLPLPGGHDPDSYLRTQGAAAFDALLKQARVDFVAYRLGLIGQIAPGDDYARSRAINELVGTVSLVGDPIGRQLFLSRIAQALGVPEDTLTVQAGRHTRVRAEAAERARRQPWSSTPATGINPLLPSGVAPAGPDPAEGLPPVGALLEAPATAAEQLVFQERECLRLLINWGRHWVDDEYPLYAYLIAEVADVTFTDPATARALALIKARVAQGQPPDLTDLTLSLEADVRALGLALATDIPELSPGWARQGIMTTAHGPEPAALAAQAYRHLLRLKHRYIRTELAELQAQMQQALTPGKEGSAAASTELLTRYMAAKQTELTLARELGMAL